MGLAAGFALAGAGQMSDAVADQRNAYAAPVGSIAFDVPAQPLVTALESYSVASGWQVIYDGNLATGRRSTAVKGFFAPSVALRMLLAGTGLIPQYMATDGVMLVPDSVRQEAIGDGGPPFRGYYGRVQAGLKRAFCADRQIRSGAYRIALGFWIGASGAVTRVVALGSTGKTEIDAAFDRAVHMLSIGDPPPAGFSQPVVIVVTPDLLTQCKAAVADTPARTNR